MITYIINTSEKKTFDSNRLFELSGYTDIRWMPIPLDRVDEAAREIAERQNVLNQPAYRLVVLLDLYAFDRIRKPYEYEEENKVETEIYKPFLKAYLAIHLFDYLQNHRTPPRESSIYYIQNDRNRSEKIGNEMEQIARIVTPDAAEAEQEGKQEPRYASFTLYCTPHVSLSFRPFKKQKLTFNDFVSEIGRRCGGQHHVQSYEYEMSGDSEARSAYDVLALSLSLVYMYRGGRDDTKNGAVLHPDEAKLEDLLKRALEKIRAAKRAALDNRCKYIDLLSLPPADETAFVKEGDRPERMGERLSVEEYYTRICALADAPEGQDRPQEEIDALMARYLHRRDDECEGNAEERLYDQKKNNQLKEIDRCPTESDRALAKEQKNRDIQALFTQVLQADYESADYSEEKKQAGKVYDRYKTLQAKLSHHLGWDIFFAVFTLLCMIVPYAFLQRTGMLFTIPSFVLYGIAAGQFAGILFLCWFGFSLPLKRQLRRAQGDMAAVYRACKQKQEDSLRLLRERYGRQLLLIERRRYEIREIDRIYRENVRKNENIQKHRDMLEEVGDQLSGILNNLGEMGAISSSVELEPDEFDLEKPFDAPENKVYRVFSAEAIEQAELFRTGPVDRV